MSISNTDNNMLDLQQTTSAIGIFPTVGTGSGSTYNSNTIVNSNPYWATVATTNYESFFSDNEKMVSLLVTVLKESEIREILGRISLLKNESENWKKLLVKIVRSRHLSQEFLMNYIENLTFDDVKVQHYSDLATGDYSEVFLYFNLK